MVMIRDSSLKCINEVLWVRIRSLHI